MSAITPDGFAGALIAVESIEDARVLLHGPGGCRFRYMRLSRELYSRGDDGIDYDRPYFFHESRVPCTFIDDNDYIGGGLNKIRGALEEVSGIDGSLIVVLNSPGMALIGDDVDSAISELGLGDRVMTIDENLVSLPMSSGFDRMLTAVLDKIGPVRGEVRRGTVNLYGITTLSRDWKHGTEELTHILELMGLEVLAAPGTGSSLSDLRRGADAEFGVCVFPEFCEDTAEFYRERFGIGYCCSPAGAPVGFDATRSWIASVAEFTGADPTAAYEYLDSTIAETKRILMSDLRTVDRIRTATYSVRGELSAVRPLTKWLYGYLSMLPKAISVERGLRDDAAEGFRKELEELNLDYSWGREMEPADFMLGPGDVCKMYCLDNQCMNYVDLGFPPKRAYDFKYNSILGVKGALYILDCILNV